MEIQQYVDGTHLGQMLTQIYEVSTCNSASSRIPFFGWQKVRGKFCVTKQTGYPWSSSIAEGVKPGIFYRFDDVTDYLAKFKRCLGTYPHYESYQAWRLIAERLVKESTIYTFESLPA